MFRKIFFFVDYLPHSGSFSVRNALQHRFLLFTVYFFYCLPLWRQHCTGPFSRSYFSFLFFCSLFPPSLLFLIFLPFTACLPFFFGQCAHNYVLEPEYPYTTSPEQCEQIGPTKPRTSNNALYEWQNISFSATKWCGPIISAHICTFFLLLPSSPLAVRWIDDSGFI